MSLFNYTDNGTGDHDNVNKPSQKSANDGTNLEELARDSQQLQLQDGGMHLRVDGGDANVGGENWSRMLNTSQQVAASLSTINNNADGVPGGNLEAVLGAEGICFDILI